MKSELACSFLVVLIFTGCRESPVESRVSPHIAAEINRIQLDHNLSDQEISDSLERWTEVYAGTRALLESEDGFGSGPWSPERFAELMSRTEQVLRDARQEDRMLAIMSLGYLSALNDKRYDQMGESLRGVVVKHYSGVEGSSNEVDRTFIRKVDELAETDSELKRSLAQRKSGESAPRD